MEQHRLASSWEVAGDSAFTSSSSLGAAAVGADENKSSSSSSENSPVEALAEGLAGLLALTGGGIFSFSFSSSSKRSLVSFLVGFWG